MESYNIVWQQGENFNLTDEDVEDINSLLKELADDFDGISREELREVASNNILLFVRGKKDEGGGREPIVGLGSLIYFRQPIGMAARVEDMIVTERCRGHGLGKKLVLELINHGRRLGARYIDLTSNPAREAANALYQRVGFERRQTNVYRLPL